MLSKSLRHLKITELIKRDIIQTQEELAAKLKAMGFNVTQATVSRDIKELRLVKVLCPDGRYKYTLPEESVGGNKLTQRMKRLFKECVTSIDFAGNIVVVKALPGTGPAVGEAIDGLAMEEVVGTVAGDNTVLVVARSNLSAGSLSKSFRELLELDEKP